MFGKRTLPQRVGQLFVDVDFSELISAEEIRSLTAAAHRLADVGYGALTPDEKQLVDPLRNYCNALQLAQEHWLAVGPSMDALNNLERDILDPFIGIRSRETYDMQLLVQMMAVVVSQFQK
jgi:hypothetical protein